MIGIELTEEQSAIKHAIEDICAQFDDHYWLGVDNSGEFPQAFVDAIVAGGWLGVAMPESVGGAGLGLTEAALIMQTVARSGAGFSGASAIHLNVFGLLPIVKFGTPEQQQTFLARVISGEDKTCFAVTEPNSGLDTASLETKAERTNSGYRITGRKIWTTNAQRANKMLIIARTTPKAEAKRATDGLSLFYTDFDRKHIDALHHLNFFGTRLQRRGGQRKREIGRLVRITDH